jgi:hypothetical protein
LVRRHPFFVLGNNVIQCPRRADEASKDLAVTVATIDNVVLDVPAKQE